MPSTVSFESVRSKRATAARRGTHGRVISVCVLSAVLFAMGAEIAVPLAAEEPDFSTWQRLPVFHNGRMQPVNTFARMAVESICDRANPYLSLAGVSEDAAKLPEFNQTKKLFPEELCRDGRRKFTAPELLFSWIVEPERWEYVPFLIAKHGSLREDILGLPNHSKQGKKLKYVSPYDLEQSDGFSRAFEKLVDKRRRRSDELKLSSEEVAIEKLYEAYATYRSIAYSPFGSVRRRINPGSEETGSQWYRPFVGEQPRFSPRLNETVELWNDAVQTWEESKTALTALAPPVYEGDVDAELEAVRAAIVGLVDVARKGPVDPIQAELELGVARAAAVKLAATTAAGTAKIYQRNRPDGTAETAWNNLRSKAHVVSSRAARLISAVDQARLGLYESDRSIRLLPGLNAAALEKNREIGDDAQPWVGLRMILYAGDDVYRDFLRPDLPEAQGPAISPGDMSTRAFLERLVAEGNPARTDRAAFAQAAAAYIDREADDRDARFNKAMDLFAAEIRGLGEAIEPHRKEMKLRQRDEELIALTAYPAPGSTDLEVRYYEIDPFLWCWVVSFLSLCCLGAAFGALRGPMYWIGIFFLVLGLSLSTYGFVLRTVITGWAPVTNMFETVVFVAMVTGLLGLCFAVLPLFGPGLRRAWRMTAIPGSPEAGKLGKFDLAAMSKSTWTGARAVLLLPRLALTGCVFYWLTMIQYGEGTGYTAIRLVPRGASVNDYVVWGVGLMMLAIALWLVPRVVMTALLGVCTLPWSLAQSGLAEPMRKSVDRWAFAVVGAGTACVVGLLAYYAPIWDKNINPLMPVLRDNFWLTLHVLSITASYGAGFLAWGLGVTAMAYYAFGRYRAPIAPSKAHAAEGHRPAHGYKAPPTAFHRSVPEQCVTLSGFIYKAIQVAVVLLAAGTILGGLWADVSWGRFWGWDPKEVWALISLLVYVVILHFRFIGVLRDFALAAGAILAITSIVMAWWGVNFFLGSGMHSYGNGAGGGHFVLGFIALNCVVVTVGAMRYLAETSPAVTPTE